MYFIARLVKSSDLCFCSVTAVRIFPANKEIAENPSIQFSLTQSVAYLEKSRFFVMLRKLCSSSHATLKLSSKRTSALDRIISGAAYKHDAPVKNWNIKETGWTGNTSWLLGALLNASCHFRNRVCSCKILTC